MRRIISILLVITITLGAFVTNQPMRVYADESKILTLGKDLSEEQKQLILEYLGIDINNVVLIEVNNQDEHKLLDNIATHQQIGTRTFSCSYIEPTSFGGIHVKTVNLSWVTSEMIRNALVTSGITNCNIICISPIEVSGTGSLTGIFKAYESISGVELTEESKELASEELITTCTIAGALGQGEASKLVSELKSEIIVEELNTEEQIKESIEKYVKQHNIALTEEDMWKLVDLLLKISQREYDIEEIKQAYADIRQTAEEVREATEKTIGFFESIWNWLVEIWQKITGKEGQEQVQILKDTMGILANTDDSLLGNSTIVTTTVEDEVLQEIESTDIENNTEKSEDEKGHWYDFIIKWFNTGNKKVNSNKVNGSDEVESKKTFEDFEQEAKEYQEELEEIKEDTSEKETGLLQFIKQDFENLSEQLNTYSEEKGAAEPEVKSFNELTSENHN